MNPNFLKKKNFHPRDKRIKFYEGPHLYTIDGEGGYTSVTTWNHSHFQDFNADNIIANMMKSKNWPKSKYYGMTPVEIKKKWDCNRDEASSAGTKMHFDIECFYNGLNVTNESIEFEYFKQFYNDYKHLIPYRTEWEVFHEELKFSGSIDMSFVDENGHIELCDWKRCKEIKKDNPWQSAKTDCISHLPDTNFWHYTLQLNIYKAILESKYDKKVTKMYLVCLHPNNSNSSYLKYEVSDLSKEIKELFELRMTQLSKLEKESNQVNQLINKLNDIKYNINDLLNQKDEILNKLSILDEKFEEDIEVDTKYYNETEYLVDNLSNYIYNENGEIIGLWLKNKPKLFK